MTDLKVDIEPAYTVHKLPWDKHPLDPKGRSLVARGPNGHFISIACNAHANYFYSVRVTQPEYFCAADAPSLQVPKRLTGDNLDMFLSRFEPGELVFGDDVYAGRAASC